MTKEQLEFCINEVKEELKELRFEFDLLWSEHTKPVRMRHLGCQIIALEKELKELEKELYDYSDV